MAPSGQHPLPEAGDTSETGNNTGRQSARGRTMLSVLAQAAGSRCCASSMSPAMVARCRRGATTTAAAETRAAPRPLRTQVRGAEARARQRAVRRAHKQPRRRRRGPQRRRRRQGQRRHGGQRRVDEQRRRQSQRHDGSRNQGAGSAKSAVEKGRGEGRWKGAGGEASGSCQHSSPSPASKLASLRQHALTPVNRQSYM
jgi:hypothetical protein